jgi:hypothetical protein
LLGLLIAVVAAAALTLSESLKDDSNYPLPVDSEEYGDEWFWADTDGDGANDYAFRLNERGDLWYEVMDFNGDGMLDNFYYRQAGVLVQQELDTNFDGVVDLWVLMEDGIHVRGYMRDTDFDGSVDVEKDYGE